MSEAEYQISAKLVAANPALAAHLNIESCAELQADYIDLQDQLQECWQDSHASPHACALLAAGLRVLRQKMTAAGCPIPSSNPPGELP